MPSRHEGFICEVLEIVIEEELPKLVYGLACRVEWYKETVCLEGAERLEASVDN